MSARAERIEVERTAVSRTASTRTGQTRLHPGNERLRRQQRLEVGRQGIRQHCQRSVRGGAPFGELRR